MMNKKKSSWAGLCKYTLTLPLFTFLLLSANAWSNKLEKANLIAQNDENHNEKTAKVVEEKDQKMPDGEKAYTIVEQLPEFPGGTQGLLKYIQDNLKYPASAAEKGIQGRTLVRFIVSKTGTVSDIEIVRGIDAACDAEAVRVIKMMPKWTPGKQNGKDVAVYFTLPIVYKLKDSKFHVGGLRKGEPAPLIIVDGEEKSIEFLGDTTKISPKNIESLSVLKDSSAIEKYGEKGKNGVIVVKTKKR